MTDEGAGRRFEREVERVRLRAALAGLLASPTGEAATTERLRAELRAVEDELRGLRAVPGRPEALAARLGLDADELELVWSAVAATCDPRLQPHLQVLGGSDARRGLTLATQATLTGLEAGRALALSRRLLGGHALVAHQLLLPAAEGGASPAARPLQAAPRLCTWLAGDARPDPAMQGAAATVVVPAARELDAAQQAAEERMAHVLGAARKVLLVIDGPSSTGRRTAAAAAAGRALGREVVALDLSRLPPQLAALEAALAGLGRECLLGDALPLVANVDPFARGYEEGGGPVRLVARFLDGVEGPAILTTAQPGLELPVERPVVRLAYGVPEARVRGALWRRALPAPAHDGAGRLDLDGMAIRYRLGPGGIGRAVASARLLAGDRPVDDAALVGGVRSYIAERLGDLAQRVEVRQRWEDLVLAPDLLDQARALVARVRHAHRVLEDWGYAAKLPRGVGVAALFSGPPGTGKTMLAGLIARDLGLELYQVDLSKVVSKWVGETEKQLSRVFEAADAGHALLLFDEADALFGKRTEVRSAMDRYANLEVNYLLQRIESFGGVTILTTNMDATIDPALRRRLACQIAFWPPDLDERVALWTRLLAANAPLAPDLDLRRLAERYPEMTGANIRNAVLAGAFLAASEGSSITQPLLERAARGEYAAMGRVLRGAPSR